MCDMWTQACCGHKHPSALHDPMIHCMDIGEAGTGHWDASLKRSTLQEISPSPVILAVSYPSWDDGLNHNDVIDEVSCTVRLSTQLIGDISFISGGAG